MPRSLALAALSLLCALAAGTGCFGVDDPPPNGHGSSGQGKLFIQWTLGGSPPSDTLCAGVDHLVLSLDTGSQSVQISPITCSLTRFRYDGLPEGRANLRLEGVDAAGCRVTSGTTPITLATTLPASPSPTVSLSAVKACP